MWVTSTMMVWNDLNLRKYLGEFQLDHFRELLKRTSDPKQRLLGSYDLAIKDPHLHICEPEKISVKGQGVVGCYPLEISGTNLYLNAPQKPRQWDGFRNISFSMISQMVEEAKKGLDAVCTGISDQKEVKEKVYRFALTEKDTSGIIPDTVYLPQNQVDYVKSLYPLTELNISVRETGVYFKRENFIAGLGMLNPGLFRS